MAFCLYAFVGRLFRGEAIWSLLAVIVLFSSSILLLDSGLVVAEFQKQHIVIGSFLVFISYWSIVILPLSREAVRRFFPIQLIVVSALLVISPISLLLYAGSSPAGVHAVFFEKRARDQILLFRSPGLLFFKGCCSLIICLPAWPNRPSAVVFFLSQ
jgi:hypothetical protein